MGYIQYSALPGYHAWLCWSYPGTYPGVQYPQNLCTFLKPLGVEADFSFGNAMFCGARLPPYDAISRNHAVAVVVGVVYY